MSDVLLGALASISLVGTGILLLLRDPAKLSGIGAKPEQLRQGGVAGIVLGAAMAAVTVYLFLRGAQ
jgi:hypothetical protein